jgi:NADH-quinone oxidoreductase subunit G
MAKVLINNIEVELDDNERLNGIQAAARVGIDIPRYCWHPALTVVASCRMCLVETGTVDNESGQIKMMPKLVPACQTPARDGTVFVTDSENVKNARAMVEEDLLVRHPIDCPICDKAGECYLQDYHFEHGRDQRRADIKPFHSRRRSLGDTVTLFVDRCVMCSRCVRFCQEVAGTSELMITGRGSHEEIDVFPGFPLENKLSGNVVDLCPVGALGDKEFLYSQRVWFMKNHANVCAGCSTGCSIFVDENQDHIYRLRPRENPHINEWWMCDEGRYGWHHVHSEHRQTEPRKRDGDELATIEWSALPAELDKRLREAGHLAAVVSPHLAIEEAYLLVQYIRSIDEGALIAVGPIPTEGEDEVFKNGFTIRAEKCPNRRGVEKIVARLGGFVLSWDDFLERIPSENLGGVWISGGYKSDWNDLETAERFADVPLVIVQDLFASPLWDRADYQLPGASFAERTGSYVNHADRLQSFKWAIRAPAGVMVEGQLYWRLLKKPGLYNAESVLADITREIGYFAAAMQGVAASGVDLKVNLVV